MESILEEHRIDYQRHIGKFVVDSSPGENSTCPKTPEVDHRNLFLRIKLREFNIDNKYSVFRLNLVTSDNSNYPTFRRRWKENKMTFGDSKLTRANHLEYRFAKRLTKLRACKFITAAF